MWYPFATVTENTNIDGSWKKCYQLIHILMYNCILLLRKATASKNYEVMVEICESGVLTDVRITRLKSGWTVTPSILRWESWAKLCYFLTVFEIFCLSGLCETLFVLYLK